MDLDTGLVLYCESKWKFPLQIFLLEVCLFQRGRVSCSCFKGCDWPPFFRVARAADFARLIPRAKGVQSNWRETVTLGCPRWVRFENSRVVRIRVSHDSHDMMTFGVEPSNAKNAEILWHILAPWNRHIGLPCVQLITLCKAQRLVSRHVLSLHEWLGDDHI
jgi:hypothetical protein